MEEKNTSKFTFSDWHRGDVTLEYATIVFEKGNRPNVVEWSNFPIKDRSKIETFQKRIFNDSVNSLLEEHKLQFLSRLKNSKMKESFLRSEIHECEKIMFGTIPNIEYVPFDHWGILIEYQNLSDIQFYIKRTIKNGINDGYDFIHSPNNKFQDRRRPDYRIYGTFLWEYMNWLKLQNKKPQEHIKANKHLTTNWFKVGLEFANGRIDELYSKHYQNASAVARELGNEKGFRPFITDSIANSVISNTNIFSKPSKISKIEAFCISNNITIVDSFQQRMLNAPKNKSKTNFE